MKFDFTDLRIFLSVMDSGSLTVAAARNNIVTAAVSTRMKRLETAFGLDLFERQGRGIRPTLAAEVFERQARRLLNDAHRIEDEIAAFVAGDSGLVRLISNTNMMAEHMPQVLGRFLARHPLISVEVEDRPSLEAVQMLRAGSVHMAVLASSADMSGLDRFAFVPDRLVVVAPAETGRLPLPEGPIRFHEAIAQPLIGPLENMALAQFLRRHATEIGAPLDFRARLASFEGQCRMVEAGAGLAIMAESAARRYRREMAIRILALDEAWAERSLYICARRYAELPAYAQRLYDHLRDYVAESLPLSRN